ncbi:hypothetical protein GHT06_017172 [Daphnia sinensis]|uniref:Kazal-like domain-containing protein n=1 Tax=Daphnia sinensis TaxID=1820382 RepID=A0AAD5KPI5_9CRUS|nr:hypothetical protein GHT06_017172 [Daphnia sinensis]
MHLIIPLKLGSAALHFTVVCWILVNSWLGVQGVPQEVPKEIEPQCACSELWAPVCGTDGNTYVNEGCLRVLTTKCGTIKSLISESYEGECKQVNAAATAERLGSLVLIYIPLANVVVNAFRK